MNAIEKGILNACVVRQTNVAKVFIILYPFHNYFKTGAAIVYRCPYILSDGLYVFYIKTSSSSILDFPGKLTIDF